MVTKTTTKKASTSIYYIRIHANNRSTHEIDIATIWEIINTKRTAKKRGKRAESTHIHTK